MTTRPVVIEHPGGDTIEIRPIGVLAHCFDHGACDGASAAGRLGRVRELLEHAEPAAELTLSIAGELRGPLHHTIRQTSAKSSRG